MVADDHDPMTGIERGPQFLRACAFHGGDPVALTEIARQDAPHHPMPETAVPRWDEGIRLVNDDGLHGVVRGVTVVICEEIAFG